MAFMNLSAAPAPSYDLPRRIASLVDVASIYRALFCSRIFHKRKSMIRDRGVVQHELWLSALSRRLLKDQLTIKPLFERSKGRAAIGINNRKDMIFNLRK